LPDPKNEIEQKRIEYTDGYITERRQEDEPGNSPPTLKVVFGVAVPKEFEEKISREAENGGRNQVEKDVALLPRSNCHEGVLSRSESAMERVYFYHQINALARGYVLCPVLCGQPAEDCDANQK